jgi:predicted kinase
MANCTELKKESVMEGVILMGVQASGKSAFYASQFAQTHLLISLDMLNTRRKERLIFQAALEAPQSLVVDNTNPTVACRSRYIESLKAHHFEVKGYYFQSEIGACLARNAGRTGSNKIPEKGLLATHKKLQLPSFEEGFDELFYVKQVSGKFDIKVWSDEI